MSGSNRFVGEVEVDPRRRISLGKAGKPSHRRYRVEEDELGVLTLTPVVSVPVTLIADRLRQAVELADSGKLRPRPERSKRTTVQRGVRKAARVAGG
jgi:hypothetical protein